MFLVLFQIDYAEHPGGVLVVSGLGARISTLVKARRRFCARNSILFIAWSRLSASISTLVTAARPLGACLSVAVLAPGLCAGTATAEYILLLHGKGCCIRHDMLLRRHAMLILHLYEGGRAITPDDTPMENHNIPIIHCRNMYTRRCQG